MGQRRVFYILILYLEIGILIPRIIENLQYPYLCPVAAAYGEASLCGSAPVSVIAVRQFQFPRHNAEINLIEIDADCADPPAFVIPVPGKLFLRRIDAVIIQIKIQMPVQTSPVSLVFSHPVACDAVSNRATEDARNVRHGLRCNHIGCGLLVPVVISAVSIRSPEFNLWSEGVHRKHRAAVHILNGVETDAALPVVIIRAAHIDRFPQECEHLRVGTNHVSIDIVHARLLGALSVKALILNHNGITRPQVIEERVFLLLSDTILIIFDITARHAVALVVNLSIQLIIVEDRHHFAVIVLLAVETLSVQTDENHVVSLVDILIAGVERCHRT